jgi:hypothetical protein
MNGLGKPRGRCPRCDSKEIARILWGMPAFDEDLERALDEGNVVLGGCLISEADPNRHCLACEYEWRQTRGGPVAVLSKRHTGPLS